MMDRNEIGWHPKQWHFIFEILKEIFQFKIQNDFGDRVVIFEEMEKTVNGKINVNFPLYGGN